MVDPDGPVYSAGRAGCALVGADLGMSARPSETLADHGVLEWVGPETPCTSAVVPRSEGIGFDGELNCSISLQSSTMNALRIIVDRSASDDHARWTRSSLRPSESYRAAEKALVWVGGLPCSVIALRRYSDDDHITCLASDELLS